MESAPEQITYTLQDLVNVQHANGAAEKLSKGWIVVNVPQDSVQTEPHTNGVIVKTESPGTEIQTTSSGSPNVITVTTCTPVLPENAVTMSTELPSTNVVTTCTQLPGENPVTTFTELPTENATTTCTELQNAVTPCTPMPSGSAATTCTQLPTENDTLGLQSNSNMDENASVGDDDDDDEDDDDDIKPVIKTEVVPRPKRRKKRLAVDAETEIDLRVMKTHLLDTSDTMSPPDLAPPTKKLMSWKKYGGADKLFVYPARTFNSQSAVDKTWTEPHAKTYPSLYPMQ